MSAVPAPFIPDTAPLELGAQIEFITPSGELRTGIVDCRDWWFDSFSGYGVVSGNLRFHVNTLHESGYSVFN